MLLAEAYDMAENLTQREDNFYNYHQWNLVAIVYCSTLWV